MPYIYKITNDVNGKTYVGKTVFSLEKRFQEHIQDSSRERCKDRPLYRAMNKYGIQHFHIELLEECPIDDDLNEREIYWINKLNSYHYGYNATYGGDGKSYLDWDIIYRTYLATESILETSKILGHDAGYIGKIIKLYGVQSEDIHKNATKKLEKPVAMLDKKTGEVLRTFCSIADAERFSGNKFHGGHISQVCSGKRKTAYGYKWIYI